MSKENSKLSQEQLDIITNIFHQFDKNKNGSIDRGELKTFCLALNNQLGNAEFCDIFKEFDYDKSGFITLNEFIKSLCD